MGVLLVSQSVGLVLLGSFVVVRGEGPPGAEYALYAVLAGLAGTAGIAAFYRGLAVGAMGVVAPISGAAAVIPVAVGVVSGERPSALQLTGIGLALVGIGLASREVDESAAEAEIDQSAPAAAGTGPRRGASRRRVASGVGLALVAALGFGSFFVFLDRASAADPAWALLTSKLVGLSVLGAVAATLRPAFNPSGADLRALLVVGAFDLAGQSLFALATTEGLLSVVAVLASLYPVVTIVLARLVLGERIRAIQRLGAVGALAGVALITGG